MVSNNGARNGPLTSKNELYSRNYCFTVLGQKLNSQETLLSSFYGVNTI